MSEGTALRKLICVDRRVAGVRVVDLDGREQELTAELVIGADGRNSCVARQVGALRYGLIETVSIAYYAYWNGFATKQVEIYFQPGRMVGLFPTHHDQTLIFVQWPEAERAAFKADIEGNYLATLHLMPALAERLSNAQRATRILGMAELPSFFRKPFGAGWALVGDAGHHKDPLVARGISDAWRDSQLLADAVIAGWGEPAHLRSQLVEYQRVRDRASIGLTRLNAELARLNRPLPQMSELWLKLGEAERAGEDAVTGAVDALVPERPPFSLTRPGAGADRRPLRC